MEVTFESTIDGETDVSLDLYRRQPGWRQQQGAGAVLLGGLIGLIASHLVGGGAVQQWIVGVLVGAVFGAVYLVYAIRSERGRMRKRVEILRASRSSHLFTVRLSPGGLKFLSADLTLGIPWPAVTDIVEHDDRVAFFGRMASVIGVPASAFEEPADFTAFVDHARGFHTATDVVQAAA